MMIVIDALKIFFLTILLSLNLTALVYAQSNESTETTVKIPDTVAAIWQAIDNQTTELSEIIQAGKFDEVHHRAFAIRDLATALLKHPEALSADKFEQIKTQIKFIDTIADRLDKSGDAKDKTATESNFKKLQNVISDLRAYYPSQKKIND